MARRTCAIWLAALLASAGGCTELLDGDQYFGDASGRDAGRDGAVILMDAGDAGEAPDAGGSDPDGGAMDATVSSDAGDAGATITVAQVAVGEYHSCARTVDGNVFCWGANGMGQATGVATSMPAPPTPVITDGTATELCAGHAFTCAATLLGPIKCWGANNLGQLGRGNTLSPGGVDEVDVGGASLDVADLECGSGHVCARDRSTQHVFCWGANAYNQVAATGSIVTTPVRVDDAMTQAVMGAGVSAGTQHSCVRDSMGILCWGRNDDGQCDMPPSTTRFPPSGHLDTGSFQAVAAGDTFTCGLATTGVVDCWGSVPFTLPSFRADEVAAGSGFVCFRVEGTNMVRCAAGAIVDNAAQLEALNTVAHDLSAGPHHVCGVRAGSAVCWGANGARQTDPSSVGAWAGPTQIEL
ncbi:MAG: RCC1 domain-containing protein [Sandaracinaceae bacterium]